MQVQELEAKTRDELRVLAKEHDVKGRGTMTKEQLVKALADVAQSAQEHASGDQMTSEAKVEQELTTKPSSVDLHVEADDNVVDALSQEERRKQRHRKIIEEAQIGQIVAFRTADGKCKSAKITARSSKNEMLKLQTSYGAEFKVSYDDVVWVKSGERWPRGIYNLLKGIKNGEDR